MLSGLKNKDPRNKYSAYNTEEIKNLPKVITVEELKQSRNYHIKMAQKLSFPEEYKCLLNKQQISTKSSLLKLNLTINK